MCDAPDGHLQSCTYGTTEPPDLQGTFDCKVVRVFDGDTMWAAVAPTSRSCCRVCCRLADVDAPEMPPSHDLALTESGRAAFAARDRLVELLTDVDLEAVKRRSGTLASGELRFFDASGTALPSLSDTDLQQALDAHNTLALRGGLTLLDQRDKFGRYLARVRTSGGEDAAAVLVREDLAGPHR